jgi:hypothetical protein
LSILE